MGVGAERRDRWRRDGVDSIAKWLSIGSCKGKEERDGKQSEDINPDHWGSKLKPRDRCQPLAHTLLGLETTYRNCQP